MLFLTSCLYVEPTFPDPVNEMFEFILPRSGTPQGPNNLLVEKWIHHDDILHAVVEDPDGDLIEWLHQYDTEIITTYPEFNSNDWWLDVSYDPALDGEEVILVVSDGVNLRQITWVLWVE